jgi:hypothetical protein
MMNVMQAIE